MRRIIPLAELLTFKSVYREDDNWAALLIEMQADAVHWRTVSQLAEELKTNHFFREPVYVGKDSEDESNSFWVFDGTHRACAYLLAGVGEVEVLFEDEDDSQWQEPKWLVETEIIGRDGYMMTYEGDDGVLPSLYSALMSLRLSDEVWLTSDTSSGNGRGIMVFWDSDAPKVDCEVLNAAAIRQLAAFGFDMSKLTVTTSRRINDLEGAE